MKPKLNFKNLGGGKYYSSLKHAILFALLMLMLLNGNLLYSSNVKSPKNDKAFCKREYSNEGLVNSLILSCPVTPKFNMDSRFTTLGTKVFFYNASINANTYLWEINQENFTDTNIEYTFSQEGIYEICLTAFNTVCSETICKQINISFETCLDQQPTICSPLVNGNFLNVTFTPNEGMFYGNIFLEDNNHVEDICYWNEKSVVGTSDLLFRNGEFIAHMISEDINRLGLDNFYQEGIVSKTPTTLKSDHTYILEFDVFYLSQDPDLINKNLVVGLAPDNGVYIDYNIDEILINVEEGPTYYSLVDRNFSFISNLNIENYSFEHVIKCLEFSEDKSGHLFFVNESFFPQGEASASHMFIKNISLKCGCCPSEPDFTYDLFCPKDFIVANEEVGHSYQWSFSCSDIVFNGTEITIDLPPGDCEVCLTAACDLETGATICKNITIPEPSEGCENTCEELTIPMMACEQDTSANSNFVGQIDIIVPDGTNACDGTDILSSSNDADINLSSMSIKDHPTYPNLDIITLGIDLITNTGVDLVNESIGGLINLCTLDGDVLCYTVSFTGSQCDNCLGAINIIAECNDPDPYDSTYVYTADIIIDLPGIGFRECEGTSSSTGYKPTVNIPSGSEQATVNITITSEVNSSSSYSSILCFMAPDQTQWCYTLKIQTEQCPEPPVDCIQEWTPKPAGDCVLEDGQLKYTFNMSNVDLSFWDLQICGDEAYAVIDGGGTVNVSNSFILGNKISFDADIYMPCDFDTTQAYYEMRVLVCNQFDELVCLLFRVDFPRCEIECSDGQGGGIGGGRSTFGGPNRNTSVLLQPNPASSQCSVEVINSASKQHIVELYDHTGRCVKSLPIVSKTMLNLATIDNGLYIVRVNDTNGVLVENKKLIIVK